VPSGYSGTTLVRKLGIKVGCRLQVVNPPADYWDLLTGLPENVERRGPRARSADIVHCFVDREADLARRMPGLRNRIAPDGMIWISWPKRSSGVPTDVTEDVIRKVAFANRLVDVKVCAVDDVWSGLKLVIRKADR
jgi:hypothetical protein